MMTKTEPSLDRFRTAMKFSLWMWALYWPGGGLILLVGGLDPISILVTFASLGSFIALIAFGGLTISTKGTRFEFFLERPMYLIGALVGIILVAPAFGFLTNFGLGLFSALYLVAIGLAGYRLVRHMTETGQGPIASRADQPLILFAVVGVCAFLVFIDAWIPMFGADPVGGPAMTVAVANWMNLFYPPLLMLTTRPFREPLRKPRVPSVEPSPAPTPAQAVPEQAG